MLNRKNKNHQTFGHLAIFYSEQFELESWKLGTKLQLMNTNFYTKFQLLPTIVQRFDFF